MQYLYYKCTHFSDLNHSICFLKLFVSKSLGITSSFMKPQIPMVMSWSSTQLCIKKRERWVLLRTSEVNSILIHCPTKAFPRDHHLGHSNSLLGQQVYFKELTFVNLWNVLLCLNSIIYSRYIEAKTFKLYRAVVSHWSKYTVIPLFKKHERRGISGNLLNN